ncbi:MAG: AraC family transcriptional regulator [bacterium]|nr:AraC family transcriptional regulator [bacterium]
MNNPQIPSHIEIKVENVIRRRWGAGESLTGFPGNACPLWLILEGAIEVRYPEERFYVKAGECLFSPPFRSRLIHVPAVCDWIGVALRSDMDNGFDWLRQLRLPLHWKPEQEETEAIQRLMLELVEEWDLSTSGKRSGTDHLIITGMGRTLLGTTLRSLTRDSSFRTDNESMPPWLFTALDTMEREPHLHIADIASRCGYSTAQFRRIFSACLGLAPHIYLQRIRMERACRCLETTDLAISDIAFDLGFASQAHFSRLFSRTFGLSPSRYRKQPGGLW